MANRFADKVVLVTGGGSGIGRATAQAFAAEGATVVVAGRRRDALAQTVEAIERGGSRAEAITADVTREEDIEHIIASTVDEHGSLHVAFNNAGVFEAGPLTEFDPAAWERMLATNLTGVLLCMKHEVSHMRDNGGGAIVNMASSVGAHLRVPFLSAYAAAKAAVSALSRSAAREYIGDGIRINALSPGPADTRMSLQPGETEDDRARRVSTELPIGRVGTLDEVAAAVLFLASEEAGFVVGHDLVIDGGASA
jgi:NAD(P)-dependent dehydrogenase (short-subunit alcohol dehydrogenase family)